MLDTVWIFLAFISLGSPVDVCVCVHAQLGLYLKLQT